MSNVILSKTPWAEWSLKSVLENGTFGIVYHAFLANSKSANPAAIRHISVPASQEEIDVVVNKGINSDTNALNVFFDNVSDEYVNQISAICQVKDSNIVLYEDVKKQKKINGIGFDVFIRTELLQSLPEHMKSRVIDDSEIVHIGTDICTAISRCSTKGIIHREISPSNIFVSNTKDYKLGNFEVSVINPETNSTRRFYYAPELFIDEPVFNEQTEVYALGITLYCLLNKDLFPFLTAYSKDDNNAAELSNARRINGERIPAPANGSSKLQEIVLKAIEYLPENRYKTAEDFKNALTNYDKDIEPATKTEALPVIPKREDSEINKNSNKTAAPNAQSPVSNVPVTNASAMGRSATAPPVMSRPIANAPVSNVPIIGKPRKNNPGKPIYKPQTSLSFSAKKTPNNTSKKSFTRVIAGVFALIFLIIILRSIFNNNTTKDLTSSMIISETSSNASTVDNSVYPASDNYETAPDGEQLKKPSSGEEVAIFETNLGTIKIRLFPKYAPTAVENFRLLIKDGYYNGITFHRVINDFMIQSGDPTGTGTGGKCAFDGYETFEDEFGRNLYHFRGAVSTANTGAPGSNGSQFFIVQTKNALYYTLDNKEGFLSNGGEKWAAEQYEKRGGAAYLDGQFKSITGSGHTVFGQVYEGLNVVDKIAKVDVDSNSKPLKDVIIKNAYLRKFKIDDLSEEKKTSNRSYEEKIMNKVYEIGYIDVYPDDVDYLPSTIDIWDPEAGHVLNLRSGPGSKFDLIDQIEDGKEVITIFKGNKGYDFIYYASDDKYGWILSKYVVQTN